jgi:hypothetical protein
MIGGKIDGLSAPHTDQIVAEFAIGIDRAISPVTVYRVVKYKNSMVFEVTAYYLYKKPVLRDLAISPERIDRIRCII